MADQRSVLNQWAKKRNSNKKNIEKERGEEEEKKEEEKKKERKMPRMCPASTVSISGFETVPIFDED